MRATRFSHSRWQRDGDGSDRRRRESRGISKLFDRAPLGRASFAVFVRDVNFPNEIPKHAEAGMERAGGGTGVIEELDARLRITTHSYSTVARTETATSAIKRPRRNRIFITGPSLNRRFWFSRKKQIRRHNPSADCGTVFTDEG